MARTTVLYALYSKGVGVGDGDGGSRGGGGIEWRVGAEVTANPVSFYPRNSNKNRRETIIMVIA